jgi:2-phospho-L-lactate guanylyltransferase
MTEAVWAVVVCRVGHGAKSRLASVLDAAERRRLALSMLQDVLEVCDRARPDVLSGTLAVVDEPAARWTAERAGAVAIEDHAPGDMNRAARLGITAARQRGATTVIVLPGDIPFVTVADLERLIDAAGTATPAVVVGASRDGRGTNALLLRPPNVIAPAFGPPSVERHLAAGLAAGARARKVTDLGLALDVDTPMDLFSTVRFAPKAVVGEAYS